MRTDLIIPILKLFFDKKSFSSLESPSTNEPRIGKKRIFVGSSTEGKDIAYKVILELEKRGMSPLPWSDCFKNSRPILQELEQISLIVDGAIFVGTMDDEAIIRNSNWTQMRDNVLYEYGLFSGIIGRSKCGLLVPDEETFKIPSDFLGLSCYKTYNANNVEKVISSVVDALHQTVSAIPRHETIKTRGKRLLQFVSWIRNESFRLAQDWNNETGRELVSKRIIAISGFIQDDINKLNLSNEYQKVEEVIFESVRSFPKHLNKKGHYDLQYILDSLIDGSSPNPEVLDGLIYMMGKRGLFDYCRRNNDNCCCLDKNMEHPYLTGRWNPEEDWYLHKKYRPWKFYRGVGEPVCINMAWAFGIAEATTYFERVVMSNNPFVDLEAWSKYFLPKLDESITSFERRLHEEIFGGLH